jgi:hypothetical protein
LTITRYIYRVYLPCEYGRQHLLKLVRACTWWKAVRYGGCELGG